MRQKGCGRLDEGEVWCGVGYLFFIPGHAETGYNRFANNNKLCTHAGVTYSARNAKLRGEQISKACCMQLS